MSLFRRRIGSDSPLTSAPAPIDRVTSVLGPETIFKGRLSGSGGVRIEGSFEGEVSLDGLLVIGEDGKVTSENITASVVVIAGVVKGNITAEKVEIRATGRVWGDITTSAFATQEGAFLRGQVRMEEQLDLEFIEESDDISFEGEELDEPEPVEATLEDSLESEAEPEVNEITGRKLDGEPESPVAELEVDLDKEQEIVETAENTAKGEAEDSVLKTEKRGRRKSRTKEETA